MPFTIDHVVPWGGHWTNTGGCSTWGSRTCADAFSAAATARPVSRRNGSQGHSVISVDPLYAFPPAAIERRVEETYDIIMEQVSRNRDDFVWTYVPSIPALGERRMGRCAGFWPIFPGASARAAMWTPHCPTCHSTTTPSIWRSPPTFSSCTANSSTWLFMYAPCKKCCGSPRKRGSFLCCRLGARLRPTSGV